MPSNCAVSDHLVLDHSLLLNRSGALEQLSFDLASQTVGQPKSVASPKVCGMSVEKKQLLISDPTGQTHRVQLE